MSDTIKALLTQHPIIPVISADSVEHGLRVVRHVLKQNINIVEITLRTQAAADVIVAVRAQFPELSLAIGTVTSADKVGLAAELAPDFIVSPGTNEAVVKAARVHDLQLLPGAATASEIMKLNALGFELIKFFPAEVAGGIKALQAYQTVFADTLFCPTGGISAANYEAYLQLDNVIAVGGSWMTKL